MLQAMRDKLQGWPSIVVLGVCVFAISFFGIESYFMSSSDAFVAKVGKQEITQQQYQERVNQQRQQMSAQQGDQFDSGFFEQPSTKLAIVNQMIDERLLEKANQDLGVTVSNSAVRDYIASIPSFQLNGQFDPTTYRTVLTMQRKSSSDFEDEVRASLATSLLPQAITASTLVTDADMDRYINLRLQRRSVSYIQLPLPELHDVTVTDDQLQAFYKAHQTDFIKPEAVSLKYIEISKADVKAPAAPTDEELKKRYADEKQRFAKPEQRLVSHILVDVPKNATPAQQKAALAKADKIAAQATPSDFAELAKQDSQDLGSKRQGGDLGWLEKGVANQAFDDALFKLDKNQISKPVLSDEGYHIIWLRDVRSGDVKSFADVREQLLQEAAKAENDRSYSDFAGRLTDKTYQNPTSLESAAQELGLPIKTTPMFTRADGKGLTADPKVVQAAFSDDVLIQGNNSGLVDLGNDHAVVVRVDKHTPATPQPLADVREDVRQKVLSERTSAAAKQQADALLAKLRSGESMENIASSANAKIEKATDVMRTQPGLPPSLNAAAFLLPHPAKDKTVFSDVAMPNGSYALLALDKVQGADMGQITPPQRTMLKQQMAQAYGSEAAQEFVSVLREQSKIQISKDRL